MRHFWFTPLLLISLGALMIVCFAVDGVALDVTRCVKVLHGFSMEFWSKSIGMGLIGSAGSLLLVAKKHKRLAALAISCWWLPASMSLLTMITALIYESPNQLAVLIGAIAALGLCATMCLLIGQVLVTLYLFAIKVRLQDKTA
jgi:hypothetical protein